MHKSMHLVQFDIDGTLTATTSVDEICFLQAVKEVLSIVDVDTDLTNYTHVTDQGLAKEIIAKADGRHTSKEELDYLCNHFLFLLRERSEDDLSLFLPITGAAVMLEELGKRPGIAVSLATGAWSKPARFKLKKAGLDIGHLPMASSSDVDSREGIMQLSYLRACLYYQVEKFDSVIYVGDGVWDLKASLNLGYHFIGRAKDVRAKKLEELGAGHFIPDYVDLDRFFGIIDGIIQG